MSDGATILIVDDDPDMRALVKTLIEVDGQHTVVAEAVDGPDALAVYRTLNAPPTPDVIILDNRMPELSGLQVAERILAQVPSQRIVLFTAFPDDETVSRADAIGIARVVSKDEFSTLPAIVRSLT